MTEHAKKPRMTRKSLRRPDEFHHVAGEAVGWAEKHQRTLITAGVTAVVIALVVLAFGRLQATRDDAAAAAFQSAHAAFDAGRYPDAATAFAALAQEYGRTPFGRLANLYRGHALIRSKDLPGAIVAYQEFIAAGPPAEYLRQEALNGLGHAQEASSGAASAALAAYAEAGAIKGPYRIDSLLGAARLQEASGQATAAQDIYRTLLGEAPDAEMQAFLRSKLPPPETPQS